MESTLQHGPDGGAGSDEGVTRYLTEETQRELHMENKEAIDDIRLKLDTLIHQNEIQTLALRVIIGGAANDTEALIKFREEHQRLLRYDQKIAVAWEGLAIWIIRLLLIGLLAIVFWGVASTGVLEMIKHLSPMP